MIQILKLEEIVYTILNNQLYSSTNYSAELLSDEESSSVEFNTLFADKKSLVLNWLDAKSALIDISPTRNPSQPP